MAMVNSPISTALGQPQMPALFRPSAAAQQPAITPVQQASERLGGIEQKLGQTQQEMGQFEAQKAEFAARQASEKAGAAAEMAGAERQAIEGSEAYKSLEQISKEAAQQRFEPTQRSAQENMALFGLISVLGFAIGAGGKQNSMQALAAMNGMLDGVRKGDMDKYAREKDVFNTNLKTLHDKSTMLAAQVKRITELAARNKEQARLEFESLQAEQGADFVKQYANKYGLPATAKYLEQQAKGAERMLQLAQRAEDAERSRIQTEQQRYQNQRQLQEERLAYQRQNLLMQQRFAIDRARERADQVEAAAGRKEEAKSKLMDKDVRQLEAYDSITQGLQELKRTFKPEYASLGVFGVGADISAEVKRRLGEKEGVDAMRWWSRYEQLQAPNRHALFGATLTGNELKNYQSFTAKKSDSPEFVLASMSDQIDYSRGQSELKRSIFREANKQVPSFPTRNYFGTYSGPAQPIAEPVAAEAPRSFNSVQEAEAANLPAGTKIMIGGRPATVR